MLSKRRFVSTGWEPKTKTKSIHFIASSFSNVRAVGRQPNAVLVGNPKKPPRSQRRLLYPSGALCSPSAITKETDTMSTSKQDAQAARARAIAEALQASGARSLMELLAESERHKAHLDKLCAKLEALPKVVKKKTRQ
jgi:hypothetical protein